MKQFWIQIIALTLLLFSALYLFYNFDIVRPFLDQGTTKQGQVVIQTSTSEVLLKVEIADTDASRRKGLSDRESLPQNEGMLFVLNKETIPTFWMKGVKFPLDLVWIRRNIIVDILPNVQPPKPNQNDQELPRYQPVTPVDSVLEVNAGFVSRQLVKVGDKVTLKQ